MQENMIQNRFYMMCTLNSLILKVKNALDTGDAQKVGSLISSTEIETIPLLSAKNFLIIANIAEEEIEENAYLHNEHYQALVEKFGKDRVVPLCVKAEYEISQLDNQEEKEEIMGLLGLKEKGIDKVIQTAYDYLDLITFFTCGPKEIHAWPIKKGINVRQAAGEIHSDLERGFICSNIFNCTDLFTLGTEVALKDQGKIRTEGQDYIIQDGDIVLIKFNV